ncbi:hypothetical protein TNCV_503751 [Trichonephila clavipes]|nr:hypothetical protein TNCV_503751 [Trichonephila clavipes]
MMAVRKQHFLRAGTSSDIRGCDVAELQVRITRAASNVDSIMLSKVRQKLDYIVLESMWCNQGFTHKIPVCKPSSCKSSYVVGRRGMDMGDSDYNQGVLSKIGVEPS